MKAPPVFGFSGAASFATALLVVCTYVRGIQAWGADVDLQRVVSDALKRTVDKGSYQWKTTTRQEGGGPFGGGNPLVAGQFENGGVTYVTSTGGATEFGFARKSDKAAVHLEGNWMTLEQAVARTPSSGRGGGPVGGGGFNASTVADFKLPHAQIVEWLAKVSRYSMDGDLVRGELSSDAATELMNAGNSFAGRGGRGGRPAGQGGAGGGRGGRGGFPGLRDVSGSLLFTMENGVLAQVALTTSGTRETGGNSEKQNRVVAIAFTEVGTTRVGLPADAKEILDALVAGRTPKVFVPEPGFRKLFNGHDLTGWSGRSGHWSVRDGAITGISTKENPVRGNTFLIARAGETNWVVNDFELRFAYRIVADNAAGFANSGVQYRSVDRGDHVVAGYQADFEAGSRYSGILYDEGGGAGGRGIMAERGAAVVWRPDGTRTVEGRVGDPAAIQARIRPNDWNEYAIVAQGPRLQHFINGVQTVGVLDETEGKRLSSGILAIQLHAGEPMTVQCKDIRIKTLGSADMVGGANIKLPKDFRIEMLYTVPRETEGSWVAMCADPKGRLIVCDQNGSLHRVTLPDSAGGAVATEKILLDIGGAHGLLHAFDSLYVAVNEGSKPHGVYRVRDTNGDDVYDRVEMLRQVDASGEHGLHSLVLAPDGKSIYVVIGNQSSLTEMASSRVPYLWGEDQLLRRLPTGFMDNSYAPQGYVARMDPEGKEWELVAMGFRNQFDVAFNRVGELFTYDADMEWDIGSPWYRPTRVNHVISGAEFGFRNGDAKWPAHSLDSFGEVVNVGPGSPTGIVFGYGARFPAKYQDALYLADWSFGKVRAVHLAPQGASYTGEIEDFIGGQPFPVTDFIIHPVDGSMLLAVGGRGAQSALYRVTYVGSESTVPGPVDVREQARRDLRHRLEAFHGKRDPGAVEAAWPYLGDADRAVRFAARTALEWQDSATWRERALLEKDPRKAVAAIVALARLSGRDELHRKENAPAPDAALRGRLLAALDAISWGGLTHADRLDLLRAYTLVFVRMGRPDSPSIEGLIRRFDPLFPTRRSDADALLARLLIYLEAPSAASKVVTALKAAPTQEEQIDLAVALRTLTTGWTPASREEYFRWFLKAETFRGGNTFASSIRRAKAEAMEKLSEGEIAALKPVLEARVPRQSPRDVLAARRHVKDWTVNELVPLVEAGLRDRRDFERGRKLYSELACAACHRFANEGGAVGPELTGVVGRFGVRDLLEAMVEPSKVISDQYGAIHIRKKDGDVVSGRIANLSAANVNVVEDMFDPGRMTNVRRADIESMSPSTVSMMPEGLLASLEIDEVRDLVAYLVSRGDPDHGMYR